MSTTKNLPTLRIDSSLILEDNNLWTNRFEIHSATSDKVYIVSQHKEKQHWGCSCPSYRVRRYCKHLKSINLPCFEEPYEVNIIHQ